MRMPSLVPLFLSMVLLACAADDESPPPDVATADEIRGAFAVGTELTVTADLNLRERPSPTAAILDVIPNGSVVRSAAAQPRAGWYGVTYDGVTGWVDGAYLTRAAASTGTVSARGRAQMQALVAYADAHDGGGSNGRCFEYVWRYLTSSGYGLLDAYDDAPDMPSTYAKDFAEYMNRDGNAARWGLQRLPVRTPYDAPAGAVVVVAAGSPGTSDPVAGDIAVAAGGGRFINDGPNMSYGAASQFLANGGNVLGVYVPR